MFNLVPSKNNYPGYRQSFTCIGANYCKTYCVLVCLCKTCMMNIVLLKPNENFAKSNY